MSVWTSLSIFVVVLVSAEAVFNLTILHTNDVHCRFEEANKHGSFCTENESKQGKCFGGFPRMVYTAERLRKENPNTVFLHGGDYFQGTIWYTVHKWRVVSHFVNMLNLTAMSLGNHEFDDGIAGLLPFVDRANHPILAANIDTSKQPEIDGKIKKSTVVEVGGRKIGIIGYLTTETSSISSTEKVVIFDEVKGVHEEAQRLKRNGVDIIIAVGHAGHATDMEIAEKVPDVDVVVGGHTNTFLWNGSPPSVEEPQGAYPTMVKQPSGKSVPVVQAYAFGKYMGHLNVMFSDNGEVISASGHPILLDYTVPQDPNTLQELVPWRQEVDAIAKKQIGKTRVFLEGKRTVCRMMECNLGNLITDSFIHLFSKYAGPGQWSKVSIAILNGGGVRASIDEQPTNGTITYGDLRAVAPFPNTVDLVKLTGKTLRNVFEYSVHNYDPAAIEAFGGFLQVSGVHITYDLTKPAGERVIELLARCNTCRVPTYSEVENDEVYEVAMSSFLAGGGDGYQVIKENIVDHQLTGVLDYDAIIEYISQIPPITAGLERRIRFFNATHRAPCNGGTTSTTAFLSFLLPLFSIMLYFLHSA